MAHQHNELHPRISRNPFRHHRDEQTHLKIHRHLTDINDRITEDDIRNIKIITLTATVVDKYNLKDKGSI